MGRQNEKIIEKRFIFIYLILPLGLIFFQNCSNIKNQSSEIRVTQLPSATGP